MGTFGDLMHPPLLDADVLQQASLDSGVMHSGVKDEPSHNRLGGLRPNPADSKEDVLKYLGRCLVLPVVDGRYRTPVVTLHSSDQSNLYSLLERQLRSEYLVGAEKWWKIIKTDQQLDTWRPRVHGTQLKALLNCRLPEQPDEFVTAEAAIASIKFALRPDASPESFIAELRKFVAGVEVWWDHRNSRRPPADAAASNSGSLKRPATSSVAAPPSKQQLLQQPQQPSQTQPPQSVLQMPMTTLPQLSAGNTARKPSAGRGQDGHLVTSSPVYPGLGQQTGTVRLHNNFSENGFSSRESPDDFGLGAANGGAELNPFMPTGQVPGTANPYTAGGHLTRSHSALPSTSDPSTIVTLNVGGHIYTTTLGTLTIIPGSLFWDLLGLHGPLTDPPTRTANGDLFLDRNPKVFTYVLEYLRAMANKELYHPLPEDAAELAQLHREAEYFILPGLAERIRSTPIMPQASTHAVYDSIYLETGFNSIEGPSLKEMEQRKVVVMQQMNHVLAQKALDGFFVAACDCGVNHRDGPEGMQHNLFYHILLKKVMPVPPSMSPPGLHHAALAAHMQQQHVVTQQQQQQAATAGQMGLAAGPTSGINLAPISNTPPGRPW